MPQFIVPQFIDVEDRIIGPITTRQFIMGIAAILILFLAYRFADFTLFIVEAVFVLGFYVLFAFIKVNGSPFYFFLLNIIQNSKRAKLRVWYKKDLGFKIVVAKPESAAGVVAPVRRKLVDQELSALALLVDTGGRYRPEEILSRRQATENKKQD